MSSRHNGKKRINTLDLEKNRITHRVQEILDEKNEIVEMLDDMINESSIKAQQLLQETNKKKFMSKHKDVSQTLDNCWRQLVLIKSSLSNRSEVVSSDESDSDYSVRSTSTVISTAASEQIPVKSQSVCTEWFLPELEENDKELMNVPNKESLQKKDEVLVKDTESLKECFEQTSPSESDSILECDPCIANPPSDEVQPDERETFPTYDDVNLIMSRCDERLVKSVAKQNEFIMKTSSERIISLQTSGFEIQNFADKLETKLATSFSVPVSTIEFDVASNHDASDENKSTTDQSFDSDLKDRESLCVVNNDSVNKLILESTKELKEMEKKCKSEFINNNTACLDPILVTQDSSKPSSSSFESLKIDSPERKGKVLFPACSFIDTRSNQQLEVLPHHTLETLPQHTSCSKSMDSISTENSTIPRLNIKMGDELQGVVLTASSPSNFWLQVDDEKVKLERLREALSKYCEDAPPLLQKDIHKSQYCCVLDEGDWTRVQVMAILEKESVEVFFIDYGNVKTVPINQLKQIENRFLKYPALAVCCSLGEVQPDEYSKWSDNSIQAFHRLVYTNFIEAIVLDIQKDTVVVKASVDTGEVAGIINVSEFMISNKLANRPEVYLSDGDEEVVEKNSIPQLMDIKLSDHLNMKQMNAGENSNKSTPTTGEDCIIKNGETFVLNAFIPDKLITKQMELPVIQCYNETPTSFYLNIVDDESTNFFNNGQKKLNTVYEVTELSCPPVEKVVLNSSWAVRYKNDGLWYRVKILRIRKPNIHHRKKIAINIPSCNDLVLVQYVDFGNAEWVAINELRPLLQSLCDIPGQAIHCSLNDVVPFDLRDNQVLSPDLWDWPSTTVDYFIQLLTEEEPYIAEVISVKEDAITKKETLYQMNLWHKGSLLNYELVNAKLAMSTQFGSNFISHIHSSDVPNTWNPMADDFHSQRNSYAVHEDDAGAAMIGYKANDEKRICKFYSRDGICKRNFCQFKHIITGKRGTTTDKMEAFIKCEPIELPRIGSQIIVSVSAIFNPGHFYVVFPNGNTAHNENKEEDIGEDLQSFMDAMKKSYEHHLPDRNVNLLPALGEIVVGLCDDYWHRLRVLQTDGDEAEVFSVDFGNTEWIPLKYIYPLKREFCHLPYQAVECFLSNVEPIGREGGLSWSRASREWFKSVVDDTLMTAHVLDSDGDVLYIHLYEDLQSKSITEQLIELNHARWVNTKNICIPEDDGEMGIDDNSSNKLKRIPR